MYTGIIPIWVTYYARDILKLDKVNKLNSYDNKYHVYDHEFGEYIYDEKTKKKTWNFLRNNYFVCFLGNPFYGHKVRSY